MCNLLEGDLRLIAIEDIDVTNSVYKACKSILKNRELATTEARSSGYPRARLNYLTYYIRLL